MKRRWYQRVPFRRIAQKACATLTGSLRKSRSRMRPDAHAQPPRMSGEQHELPGQDPQAIRPRRPPRAVRLRCQERRLAVELRHGRPPRPADLVPQVVPDRVVDVGEARRLVDVEDVARPRDPTSRISLMRPGALVKMAIRSDSAIASTRSWVTNTTVRPLPCQSWSSSSCSRRRVWASSGPSGSSMRMTFTLSSTSVRTIETRLRMPPESSCG